MENNLIYKKLKKSLQIWIYYVIIKIMVDITKKTQTAVFALAANHIRETIGYLPVYRFLQVFFYEKIACLQVLAGFFL
jgi:hypothetical protein